MVAIISNTLLRGTWIFRVRLLESAKLRILSRSTWNHELALFTSGQLNSAAVVYRRRTCANRQKKQFLVYTVNRTAVQTDGTVWQTIVLGTHDTRVALCRLRAKVRMDSTTLVISVTCISKWYAVVCRNVNRSWHTVVYLSILIFQRSNWYKTTRNIWKYYSCHRLCILYFLHVLQRYESPQYIPIFRGRKLAYIFLSLALGWFMQLFND